MAHKEGCMPPLPVQEHGPRICMHVLAHLQAACVLLFTPFSISPPKSFLNAPVPAHPFFPSVLHQDPQCRASLCRDTVCVFLTAQASSSSRCRDGPTLDGAGEEWCRKITSRLKPYCTNRDIDFLLLFLCSTNDWPVDTSCTLVLSRALLLTIMFFSLEKLHYCRSRGKTSLDTRVAFKNESRCRWFQLAFPTSDSYFITNPVPANTARVDAKFCHFSQRNRKCAFTNGQILSTKLGVTTGFDNPALFWQILRLALCVFLQALGGNVPEEFSCCWVSRFSFRPHEVEEGGVLRLNLSKGGLFSRKSTFKTELQFSWNASSLCLVPWNERPATAKAAWKPCLGCPYVLVNLFWKYKSMQY